MGYGPMVTTLLHFWGGGISIVLSKSSLPSAILVLALASVALAATLQCNGASRLRAGRAVVLFAGRRARAHWLGLDKTKWHAGAGGEDGAVVVGGGIAGTEEVAPWLRSRGGGT